MNDVMNTASVGDNTSNILIFVISYTLKRKMLLPLSVPANIHLVMARYQTGLALRTPL